VKNPFKKKTTSLDIEAELGRLQQKLADHQRRRADALLSLAEAQAGRREILGEEQQVVEEHSARVRALKTEADDLSSIIDEYQVAIADAATRLRDALTQEARAVEADRRQAAASKVDALAPQLQKDVAALAKTVKAMLAAIPADVGLFPAHFMDRPDGRPEVGNRMASGREAVAAAVAEALMHALPEILDRYGDDGYRAGLFRLMTPTAQQPRFASDAADYLALPADAAVAALITSRLRASAEQIRAGEVDAGKQSVTIATPYRVPAPPAEIRIVALKDFRFLVGEPGFKPKFRCIAAGRDEDVPGEVARYAISRLAAALPGSLEANGVIAAIDSKNSARAGFGPPMEAYEDIGDPLGLQRAYEQSKREFANINAEREEVARALG
jgi:hypothetical protein